MHFSVLMVRLLVLVLITIPFNALYAQGVSVSPSRIFYKGRPGQTVTQALTVYNNTSNELSLTTALKDWVRDSTGTKVYFNPGTHPTSNARWISLSESSLTIPAQQNKSLIISLTVPKESSDSLLTNSMLFLTQTREQKKTTTRDSGVGFNVLVEFGVHVYSIPQTLTKGQLEFLSFEKQTLVTKSGVKEQHLRLKIKNNSNTCKDAWLRLELTNKVSGEELKLPPVPLAMLSGVYQWTTIKLPELPKGKYLAVGLLDSGIQSELKVAEKDIEI